MPMAPKRNNMNSKNISKKLPVFAAIILALHGLIHLMGTVTYLQIGTVEGFAYKTTLLNGSWDLGPSGIAVFGALWAVAANGFLAAAVSLLVDRDCAQPMLLGVTLFSLTLTALDWSTAYAGAIINLGILAAFWLGYKWHTFSGVRKPAYQTRFKSQHLTNH